MNYQAARLSSSYRKLKHAFGTVSKKIKRTIAQTKFPCIAAALAYSVCSCECNVISVNENNLFSVKASECVFRAKKSLTNHPQIFLLIRSMPPKCHHFHSSKINSFDTLIDCVVVLTYSKSTTFAQTTYHILISPNCVTPSGKELY